jgi:DNA transposition AAA+ family ATPase
MNKPHAEPETPISHLPTSNSKLPSLNRDFILTPTAKKIHTACDLARESRTVVFVWGPSHIGKTWAVERYYTPRNNHGRTIYARMPAACGLTGMVRVIATALALSPGSRADTIARIKAALTPDTLLILDECHLLAHTCRPGSFHNCMEVIRELHDETHCGLVLIFTLLDRVRAASQKELQQLWRRGVHKVQLAAMPTKGDLAAILEHHGLKFPERTLTIPVCAGRDTLDERPYEILRQLALEEALLAITERIRYARKLAARANEKLDWNHFVDAHLRIAKNAEQEGEWA